MRKEAKTILITIIIIILISRTTYLLYHEIKMEQQNTKNIKIENKTIYLNTLTIKQKLAQMIMVRGDSNNTDLLDLNIGGVFLDKQKTKQEYQQKTTFYQTNSKINLLIATDLEGTWNPFSNFQEFPKNKNIQTKEEAYQLGIQQGKILKETGFNMNFAPIAEYKDETYRGRAFTGNKEEIKQKIKSYIKGLQTQVLGVCKHYPGKGMIKNLHFRRDKQTITQEDLDLFQTCFRNNITGVMIGHQIVQGKLNSQEKPSSISEEIISTIPKEKLIISDEINMLGLRSFYWFNKRKIYAELINSGNNIILDFNLNKRKTYKLLNQLEKDVKTGKISEEKINESVKKILTLKGYKIK